VDQVNEVLVRVTLDGARNDLQVESPVIPLDEAGQALEGLTLRPEQVLVQVPVRQRFDTRDAAVHAVISGTVSPGYWISNIVTEPKTVTLRGAPALLADIPGFVDTLPVDVTGAAGEIKRRVPLDVPDGVSTLNESGVEEGTVEVTITVMPQMGNMRVTATVEVVGTQPGDTVSKSPAAVDVLLSGPLPVLNEVSADPKLVRVLVDVGELEPGTYELTPELTLPETLDATLIPSNVQVTIERAAGAPPPQAGEPPATEQSPP
jgi:YbbR domain-containing protein